MKFLQISDYVYVNVDRIDAIARDMHGDLNICVGGSEEPWCVSNLYVDKVLAWVHENCENLEDKETKEEAIENLKGLLESNYVDSFEDAENEALRMAIKALSAIKDIKAEIKEYRDNFILANRHDLAAAAETCLMFIDKHISGKEIK